VPPPQKLAPIDTSGAGDAFNGGYLAARVKGHSIQEAALAGHRLAGWVVMQSGAIPARTADAPYVG
jgi:2-dehydro-3-deoxygluconokinase